MKVMKHITFDNSRLRFPLLYLISFQDIFIINLVTVSKHNNPDSFNYEKIHYLSKLLTCFFEVHHILKVDLCCNTSRKPIPLNEHFCRGISSCVMLPG